MEKVTRIGISIEPELLAKFDALIERRQYTNRSEAVRDIIRKEMITEEWEKGVGTVVGSITMTYDHAASGALDKIADIQHDSHSLIHSTTVVRLDERLCIEALVVQGSPFDVKELADKLQAIKGVSHVEVARCTLK